MLIGVQGQQVAANLGAGGTVKGDLVVEGDLKIEGGGSFAFDEIVEGTQVIDVTNTEAFLVRKNSDGGDVFVVDTTNKRVGIGVSSPTLPLQVNGIFSGVANFVGSGSNEAWIGIDSTGTGGDQWLLISSANGGGQGGAGAFAIYNNDTAVNGLTITSTGLVGIGTSSPQAKFVIAGNTDTWDGMAKMYLYDSNSNSNSRNWAVGNGGTGYGHLSFVVSNTKDGQPDNAGTAVAVMDGVNKRVGIGTLLPSYKLDIQNAGLTEARIKSTSSGRARLRLDATSDIPEIYFSVSGTRKSSIFQSSNGNNLGIFGFTNQNTILSADLANDRIGIGTESPQSNLEISDSSSGVGGVLRLSSPSNHNDKKRIDFASAGTIWHRIQADANTGQMLIGNISGTGHSVRLLTGNTSRFIVDDNSRISLSNNDSGTQNSVFGNFAGNALASGSQGNSAFGHESLLNTTTGDRNTAVGYQSLRHNSTGSNNVAVGYEALRASSGNSTSNNVSIGNYTLYSINTGSQNVAVGSTTLYSNTSGNKNVGVGYESSAYNKTGHNNTAVGYQSLRGVSQQSHSNNTAVGYESMYPVTTGGNNTALGYQSLRAITSGGQNTGIGTQANYSVTTGVVNTAVGNGALFYNQTGNYNTAIGGSAMGGASGNSHENNTAVGYKSLYNVTTGASNVAVGYASLINMTTEPSKCCIRI